MKIKCLGGGNEVGRSAFIVEDKQRVLLDYGIKVGIRGEPPQYPLEDVVDYAVISHPHLDHIGHLPYLLKNQKFNWYSTPPCYDVGEILWRDAIKIAKLNNNLAPFSGLQINKAYKMWMPLIYNVEEEIGDFRVKLYDAGHIIGSSIVELIGEKRVVYTGDFKLEKTAMHKGGVIRKADVLIIEGTYWDRNHPPREELERMLMEKIEKTIEDGGNVLLPSFALGRTQELIKVIRKYNRDVPIYVDGMGVAITKVYLKFPGFFEDFLGFERAVKSVTLVERPKQREKALKEPSVIIATAGMLEGGPSLYYITRLNKQSSIIITGYCVEGSNGRKLLEEGKVDIDGYEVKIDLPVDYLDFSAHAGRDEILEYIKKSNPEKVVVVHCDNSIGFAKEIEEMGFEAYGIRVGEEIEV